MFQVDKTLENIENLTMEETQEFKDNVTVVDVYDIASDIGKECEKIIDKFGADAVTSLMPKVINALELLENLATSSERENGAVRELQMKVKQLEADKFEKAEYRRRYERELETVEDQWRCELNGLMNVISKLQLENRKLMRICNPDAQAPPDLVSDGDILHRLQDCLEKQREEIKCKERMLQEKNSDVESLRSQIERSNAISRDLRRKQKSWQAQIRNLCDERADFLVQLQDQQRDITALRQRLGLAQKENEDLAKSDFLIPTNKAVYDLDDPNRPRFTTQELKDILHERNELKARVSDLEDELETYRPKRDSPSIVKINKPAELVDSDDLKPQLPEPVEEDAPVQGPLPYEPDDAPWKKSSESGIRKFFRKLFSENASTSGFPKRSLSTLSKMALSSTSDPIPV